MDSSHLPPAPSNEHVLVERIDEDGHKVLEWVHPSQLKRGVPQEHDLTPVQPYLRWAWRHLKSFFPEYRAYEDWEAGFMYDQVPEQEIAVWVVITYTLLEFIHRHPKVHPQAVFSSLLLISTGRKDLVKPPEAAKELIEISANIPPALSDKNNFTEDGNFKSELEYLR